MLPRNAYASDEEFITALRDWFAGQALAGLLANAVSFGAMMQGHPDAIADVCGTFADAMLAEREKGGDA